MSPVYSVHVYFLLLRQKNLRSSTYKVKRFIWNHCFSCVNPAFCFCVLPHCFRLMVDAYSRVKPSSCIQFSQLGSKRESGRVQVLIAPSEPVFDKPDPPHTPGSTSYTSQHLVTTPHCKQNYYHTSLSGQLRTGL